MKKNLPLFLFKFVFMLVFMAVFLFGARGNTFAAVPTASTPAITAAFNSATPITDGFITTWMTSGANQSIIIPINQHYSGQYNYSVNWGDGNVSANQTGDATHSYLTAGTYSVTITGTFPAIEMYNTISVTGNNQRLLAVQQWGNGSWKSMDNAFRYCQNLTTVANANGPVFELNASLYCMFYDCNKLNCDLNLWNLAGVQDISQMFHGASTFNGNIADWNVSSVVNMDNLFELALVFNRDISAWDVSKVTKMDNMFTNARAFNGDISHWNVGNVTTMNNMFGLAFAFNQNIGSWNVSHVTNMFFMFSNTLAFNQDLNGWDVSKVTDMSYMFQGDGFFNGDISSWNVGNVTSMTSMFSSNGAFNQDISGWDVRKVRSMTGMFSSAALFNQDISGWQTSSLTQMDGMFFQTTAFNQNIGGWDVSKVTSMNNLFQQAAAFNQNLGSWQVGQVSQMNNMFDKSGLSPLNYETTLSGWAAQTVKQGLTLGAAGLKYCSVAGHQVLMGTDNWTIVNDRRQCLVPAVPDGAGIVYVDSAIAVGGNGSSWSSALKYLSDATMSSQTNNTIKEIHIAKGSYYPSGDKSLAYSDSSFVLTRPGLKLLGGYSNGGGQYDPNLYPTLLSGDIGLAGDTSGNSINVLVIHDVVSGTDSLIVEGLTVTGGNAFFNIDNYANLRYAGGICMIHVFANTVIRNCVLSQNYGMLGSAMSIAGPLDVYLDPSQIATPQIEGCVFKNNVGVPLGVGQPSTLGSTVLSTQASPVFSHCDFMDNKAIMGGVLGNSSGKAVFYNCNLIRNSAFGMSAIDNLGNANAVLINCSILDNVNLVDDNPLDDPSVVRLMSNAVIGNQNNSQCSLINTTIVGNKSVINPSTDAPLIFNISESSSYITNSIIWGNTSSSVLDSLTSMPSEISYCLIEGVAADPIHHLLDGTSPTAVFVDTTASNFQLMSSSPAIDAGLNDSLTTALALYFPGLNAGAGGTDLTGNLRINAGIIDLGAYEFMSGAPLPVILKYFSGQLKNNLAGLRWESGVETNLKEYTIEKSLNGNSFLKLATVKPSGSNSHYAYNTPQTEPTAYYRLKITDENGKTDYSQVIKLAQNIAQSVLLYPNPAKDYINVRISTDNTLMIYNAVGRFIKAVKLKSGLTKIDISQLSSGVYFGRVGDQKLPFVKK